jgi:hypothetical protein
MKHLKFIGLSMLIAIALSACESNHVRKSKTPRVNVTGKVGEILVVCEKAVWESDLKECLDTNLTQWIMPYFPDVATFELIHKTPSHFTQGVKRWRNTLFLNIDPNYQGDLGKIERREDVWATGQLVIDVTAKDYNQLVETCKHGLDEVHAQFDEYEVKRLVRQFEENRNKAIKSKVEENFGITLELPSNSKIVTKRKNFFRIEFPPASRPIEFAGSGTMDAGSIFSGLLIYQFDYVDTNQFTLDQILRDRDTMLKYNVPHEIDGLYMGTQYDKRIYPEGNYVKNMSGTIDGVEVRGMFMFTGRDIHSTGGAFWAYHFVNPKTNKLISLSGYVDAPPTTSWTHPLREVQAILRSVELVE